MVGTIAWITGLSASGKSTFMGQLAERLVDSGVKPIQLDGDELRRIFRAEKHSYDYEGRLALAYQYSDLCGMLAAQDQVVLIATIALFRDIHAKNRRDLRNYVEIFMDTPLEICAARDSKGLYVGQDGSGDDEIAGISWRAEFPLNPHFRVSPDELEYSLTLEEVRKKIVSLQCGRPSESGLNDE